jgi:glyoxylase-like metal-dependent hydrolase (beta-lactamase superfamily II)
MTGFTEVADRVWVARYPWFDVNVTAIGSARGLVVVDTHASARAAAEVVDGLRGLRAGDVVAVVNTHVHFDHLFGNATLREAYGAVPVHAHESVPEDLPAHEARVRAAYEATGEDGAPEPHAAEIRGTRVLAPDTLLSSVRALDLGDRLVELVHPGRGHTRGDLVVRVPDADVLLAGDLVEESARPSLGEDCWPLDWPLTLDTVLQLTGDDTTVVPGHGAPVGRAFVEAQRDELGVIAETVRSLAAGGVPESQALAAGEWPWPRESLSHAVRRGYAHLPRSEKRLPLA